MTSSTVLVTCVGGLAGAVGGVWAAVCARRVRPVPAPVHVLVPALGLGLGVGLAVRVTPVLVTAACLVLLVAALPLSAIDATTRKLPDRLLLPAIPACTAFLALAAARVGHYDLLLRALAAAALVFLAFTALALAVPGQMGFGDCKAAALCTLPLGYLGWNHVLLGVLAAYLLTALFVVGRRLAGRAAGSTVPFGPFLFAGAFAALLLV